jgi:hypothetical protein
MSEKTRIHKSACEKVQKSAYLPWNSAILQAAPEIRSEPDLVAETPLFLVGFPAARWQRFEGIDPTLSREA